ncbi:hypothetical protein CgunFtcFv8_014952 [Champsocephalus gunnari]|uniref:Uncharacterized protein n=1 Tax=Champsocephalus gunnari TaxID=52237 RepID=A0AAN8E7J8_CHAGU|nr:hypothetical protein CgunFtcFv8_014952 [Champsocephalus gunnari]
MTAFPIVRQTVVRRFGDAAGLRPGGDTLPSAVASEQKNNGRQWSELTTHCHGERPNPLQNPSRHERTTGLENTESSPYSWKIIGLGNGVTV